MQKTNTHLTAMQNKLNKPTSLAISIIITSMLTITGCQSNPLSTNTIDKQVEAGTNHSQHLPLENIEVEYDVLLSSNYDNFGSSKKTEAYQKVITDSKTLQQEFAKFSDSLAPNIDFSKQSVVMDSLGLQYSGATTTSMKQVYDDGKFIHVIFLHSSRGENCPVTMALNRPHIFISMKNSRPIKVHTESVTEKCD